MNILKNFTAKELSCPHCRRMKFTDQSIDSLQKLQKARDIYNKPIMVNSAYRCPVHNIVVGGASASYHLQGRAFDMRPVRSLKEIEFDLLIFCLQQAGFSYIRWYKKRRFIHADNRPGKSRLRIIQ